jgi:hypothetical protein
MVVCIKKPKKIRFNGHSLRSWTTTRIIRIYPKIELKRYRGDVVFIKGLLEDEQKKNS